MVSGGQLTILFGCFIIEYRESYQKTRSQSVFGNNDSDTYPREKQHRTKLFERQGMIILEQRKIIGTCAVSVSFLSLVWFLW